MEKEYAFVDEFGAFGYDFDNPGCSTHFIITAIIVDEVDLETVSNGVEAIRKRYFQTGEMKSSKIKGNHRRRIIILNEVKKLPFHIFTLVVDKRKIYENSGLRYKKSFYKFLNNLVYKELKINFSNLIISADEIGENDFLQSFAEYVRSKEVPLSLFDKSLFHFENSKDDVIIQLADLVSGSLAYNFDEHKKSEAGGYNYLSILNKKILCIKVFPETFKTFNVHQNDLNPEYNPMIANICYRRAESFVKDNQNSDDLDVKEQLSVLNYLLFRFMNKSPRNYIPTKELINQLVYLGYEKLSLQTFRNRIIAKLRDKGIIISSSREGYKIPSTEHELYNFVDHSANIIKPMLSRLKICNDIIKTGSRGTIDLFERPEYKSLATMMGGNS
jgi:hypothetical protein